MRYLKESKEFFQTKLRQLNKLEKDYLKKFIEVMKLTFAFSDVKKKGISEEQLDKFIESIEPYLKYPFSKRLKKFVSDVKSHKITLGSITATDEETSHFLKIHEEILKSLRSGDVEGALKLNTPDRMEYLSNLDNKRKGITYHAATKFSNPFHFESNFLFFNKDNLIHNFSKNEIADLEKCLNNNWTDYKKSLTEIAEPNALIYAIQNLKNKSVDRVDKNVDDWLRFNFQNDPNYKKVLELTNHFLNSNDKKVLSEVMLLVNQIPLLKRANDKLKKSIKTVYRGIPIPDEVNWRENEIIDRDKKQEFVSTSTSKHAAKNFALQKGHLESEDSRRTQEGVILEYSTSFDSIILCVEIFGSVFGEREVLIDPKKAKVTDVLWI